MPPKNVKQKTTVTDTQEIRTVDKNRGTTTSNNSSNGNTTTSSTSTVINDAGKTILKTTKPMDPIEVKRDDQPAYIVKNSYARIDEVIEIARRVREADLENFDLIFNAAMKVYVMTNFRTANNLSIKVDV